MALFYSRIIIVSSFIVTTLLFKVHAQDSVLLLLKGAIIANNSYVDVDDIGEGDNALLCHTDKADCCTNMRGQVRAGEWYFEDMRVGPLGNPTRNNLFYRNRGTRVVRLNLRGSPPRSERGRFRCTVPDANNITQTLFVNIVDVGPVNIFPSTAILGESFMLTCIIPYSRHQIVTFEWFFGLNSSSLPSGVVVSNVTKRGSICISSLQFTSLLAFHIGLYTCQLGSDESVAATTTVTVEDVHISLGGEVYGNNSDILITNIGEENEEALFCITDNSQCCSSPDTPSVGGTLGEWFYPNGSLVGENDHIDLQGFYPNGSLVGENDHIDLQGFYKSRGTAKVQLSRREGITSPTGKFCCQVPNANNTSISICVNLILPTATTPATSRSASGSGSNVVATVATTVFILIFIAAIAAGIGTVAVIFFRRRTCHKASELDDPGVYYSTIDPHTKMTWKKKLPQIITFPSDMSATEGKAVCIVIKVSEEFQPTVTWYHNGEPIEEDYAHEIEADGSLILPSVEVDHSGIYKALVTNENGSVKREMKLTVIEEGRKTKTALSEIVYSRLIPVSEFVKCVAELHTNSDKLFKDLYQALDSGEDGRSTSYATDPQRCHLNRFGNIVVYDDNCIILNPLPDNKDYHRDYINASYIDGYSTPNKFIAAQGPLSETEMDFWWLIWQERSPIIVMLTNEVNRAKCQQYWPDSGKKQLGPFHVMIADQQVFADYTIRTLSVSLGYKHSHKVTQFHFTAWPDHGVPEFGTSLLSFHRRVKTQHHHSKGPILIHCSAGVGRTGTYIAIDNVLEQIEKEQVVDIPGAITKIRQNRMKMVQTHKQFAFIHDAVLESIICGDTEIAADGLGGTISKMKKRNGFQHQLELLEQVSPNLDKVQCSIALAHSERNRDNEYLPSDRWRVTLKGEHPDYIHALYINGYKQKKAFIIAQNPMESTVRNFWKMICDRKSAVVVMLSDLVEEGREASAQYWPSSGIYLYGEYGVELLGEEPLEGFTIRNLSVIDVKTQSVHQVTQLHITNWTASGQCSNLESIIYVIEEMTKVQIRSGNKPIVVHCSDTVTRSGMFCAIATTIERCKTEGVVDVFQVVKALRVQKPGAVPTVAHYKLIFDAVLIFLESFESYANFQ